MTTGTVHPQVRASTPRRVLAVSALTGWLAAGASALLFVLLGRVVDGLAADALPAHDAAPAPTAWVLWAVLLGLVVAVCTGAGAWWSERTSAQAEKHLRAAVVSAVFRGGAVRASAQAGRLLAAATTSVEKTATTGPASWAPSPPPSRRRCWSSSSWPSPSTP